MKHDELVSTVAALTAVAERHRRSIVVTAGAILLLAGAVTAGVIYSHSRRNAALDLLAAVQMAAASPVLDTQTAATALGSSPYTSEKQKYEDVARLAERVLSQYPSSQAARWAIYWKALAEHKLGSEDAALQTITRLSEQTTEGFLHTAALLLEAQIQEARGEPGTAAQIYARVADEAPEQFPVEVALMGQARMLEEQGQHEQALDIYRRLTQEYPESPFAGEASAKLGGAGSNRL